MRREEVVLSSTLSRTPAQVANTEGKKDDKNTTKMLYNESDDTAVHG
jgi:hypothetical protein